MAGPRGLHIIIANTTISVVDQEMNQNTPIFELSFFSPFLFLEGTNIQQLTRDKFNHFRQEKKGNYDLAEKKMIKHLCIHTNNYFGPFH